MADISKIILPDETEYDLKDVLGRKEAYLEWGGKNLVASYGPIDAAMVPNLGANRFAFLDMDGITIEYTRDAGVTWIDYGASAENIGNLFTPTKQGTFIIGKADSSNKATENEDRYQLRINIDTSLAHVYTALNKFVFYISTNGSANCTVSLYAATKGNSNTYSTKFENVPISGWSGYNVVNCSGITTYGNTASQYRYLRFIFKANGGNTNYYGLSLYSVMAFGGVGWTSPSTMAKSGYLYSMDYLQNATFPASVAATNFNGKINNHTIESDVPANAKFTDTTYSAGSNITLTDTTFSLTKANVVGALGYTPPEQDTNTTYSAGTGLVLDSNKFYNKGAEFIRGTQTAATAAWTGVTLDPELYDGKEIVYFLPFAGTSSASTLNLTLSTGETTGAKYVYFNSTTRHTNQYGQYQMIRMVYHESLVIDTTTYSGWWIDYARDLNDNSNKSYLQYSAANALRTAAAGGRYTLTFTKDDQHVLPITSTDNKISGQAKTYTTDSFDPFGDIFYRLSASTIAANATVPNGSLYRQYMVDARYSFTGVTNSASTSVMKAGDPVYIVCVPQSDGKVKLHSNPLGLAKPTTDDGLLYILLGHAYNSYQFELLMYKPVYHFKDGAVRLYNGSGSSYDSATETLTINL